MSWNKSVGKLRDGLTVMRADRTVDFVADIGTGRFHGINTATTARRAEMGIATECDCRRQST